jgi:4'-phosphopantetheinyl transferase
MTRRGEDSTSDLAWRVGPRNPRLSEGGVHVWRADLATVADEVLEALSPDERARANRLINPLNARLWEHSRGVLRALLGRYLEEDPRELRFILNAHGKPDLPVASLRAASSRAHLASLHFNLSHSGRLALYAFAADGPVGVDVEVARRARNVVALARRAFNPAEADRLRAMGARKRDREFLRAWVRHEAQLKCLGTGLPGADALSSERPPWVTELEVGARAAGAVAAIEQPARLSCWEWRVPSNRAPRKDGRAID